MSCYIVQEGDGTRFELEDESGFLLLEFCPPGGVEYHPVGDRGPSLLDANPARRGRRGRRRRREMILDEEELITVLLNEL